HPHPSLFFFFMTRPPPSSTLFPYTTLFRSLSRDDLQVVAVGILRRQLARHPPREAADRRQGIPDLVRDLRAHFPERRELLGLQRSEEHTSELQSRGHLVCRLLLEKKKKKRT